MCLTVLREPFVVPCVAAGPHSPADRALDTPATWEDDEALGALGPVDGLEGDVEEFAGPVDELAGPGGVGPDLRNLRMRQAQPPEQFAGGVPVGNFGCSLINWVHDSAMPQLTPISLVKASGADVIVLRKQRITLIAAAGLVLAVAGAVLFTCVTALRTQRYWRRALVLWLSYFCDDAPRMWLWRQFREDLDAWQLRGHR